MKPDDPVHHGVHGLCHATVGQLDILSPGAWASRASAAITKPWPRIHGTISFVTEGKSDLAVLRSIEERR